jgi:hypothetical protein
MTRKDADAGDVPAQALGLGFDEAVLTAAEAAEEQTWREALTAASPPDAHASR